LVTTSDETGHQIEAAQSLDARIQELLEAFWDDYGVQISRASLTGLRRFFQAAKSISAPTLGAESDALIVATWRAGDRYLSLKFIDEKRFHYALAVEAANTMVRPWGTSDSTAFLAEHPAALAIMEQADQV
jgi:hypothetical protein